MLLLLLLLMMMMMVATPIVAMFSTLLRLMVSFELSLAFFCFNGNRNFPPLEIYAEQN
jgi:hypothetical protein